MRRGRWSVAALPLGLALLGGAQVHADTAARRNNEGNRLYNQERYDEALETYTDAQALRPQASELHYNIGNVLFRKGEFDKAAEEYLRALAAEDPDLARTATFNRGTALMMEGKVQDAVNAYIQALRADPTDQDAKRNLELALRLMQEQQQQQQGSGEPQDGEGDQQQRPQPNQGSEGDREDEPPPERRPGEMSPEEARQILDALRDEEKEGVKKHAQATVEETRTPEKDW
jgi:tetratricopeptide (TPR) repeat protein